MNKSTKTIICADGETLGDGTTRQSSRHLLGFMIGAFMRAFGDAKLGRAEALQKAMLALLADKANPARAHPFFWAPFVVVGEGRR